MSMYLMSGYAHLCVHMWRPEVIGRLLLLSTLTFETGSLNESETCQIDNSQ